MGVLSQLLNGALAASVLLALTCTALVGQLVWLRVVSLSLAASFAAGAYTAHLAVSSLHTDSVAIALFAAALGGGLCASVGALLDSTFHRKGAALALMCSLGFVTVIQGLMTFLTGGGVTAFGLNVVNPFAGGAWLGQPSWLPLGIAMASFAAGTQFWIGRTWAGRAAVAIGDSVELALVLGVNPRSCQLLIQTVGGAVAGAAGLLGALDAGLRPDIGFAVVLKAFGILLASGSSLWHVLAWAAGLVVMEQFVGFMWGGQLREATGPTFLALVLLAGMIRERTRGNRIQRRVVAPGEPT